MTFSSITPTAGSSSIFEGDAAAPATPPPPGLARFFFLGAILFSASLGGAAEGASDADDGYPLPSPPKAASESRLLRFSAGHADYTERREIVHMSSAARVDTGDLAVKSDELYFSLPRSYFFSPDFIIMEGSSHTFAGSPGLFRLRGEDWSSGWAWNARASYGHWNVAASSAEWADDGSAVFRQADITSCPLYPDPDYRVHSSYVKITPAGRLWAFNDVLYLGERPVFYSPVLTTRLPRDTTSQIGSGLGTQVNVGQMARNGYFVRSWTPLTLGRLRARALVDYYQLGGPAGGLILGRNVKSLQNSALFYDVQDPILNRNRWVAFGNYSERLSKSLSFQGRLQDQSDANVGNDYLANTPYDMPNQLINSAGLTGHWSNVTAVAAYSRTDQAQAPFNSINDAAPQTFVKVAESESLSAQSAPVSLSSHSWVFMYSGQAANAYALGQGYLSKTAQGSVNATRTWRPTRNISFASKVAYQANYSNVEVLPGDVSPSSNVIMGLATATNDLRWRSPLGSWDFKHAIAVNQRPNGLAPASGSPDYGIQSNQATIEDMLQPTSLTMIRFQSGYNLQQTRGQPIGFRDRVSPITADADYFPGFHSIVTLHEVYLLDGGNQSTIASAQWGDRKKSFLNVSAGYLNPGLSPGALQTYNATVQAGWRTPGSPWQVTGTLGAQTQTAAALRDGTPPQLFDKEISISRDWHDFHANVSIIERTGNVRSIGGNLQLVFPPGPKTTAERNAYWEGRWAPASWAARASSSSAVSPLASGPSAPAKPPAARAKKKGLLAGFFCALGMGKGCAAKRPPKGWKAPPLYLRPLVNKTQQPGLDLSFNQPLLDEIMRDGRLHLAPEGQAAYQILFTLTRYDLQPLQTSAGLAPSTYMLKISGDLALDDGNGKKVWSKDNVFGLLVYTADTLSGGITERQARAQIWDFLARRVVAETISGLLDLNSHGKNR
jgi:hypothetical protein